MVPSWGRFAPKTSRFIWFSVKYIDCLETSDDDDDVRIQFHIDVSIPLPSLPGDS